jgi:hypothetical protein
LADSCLIQRSLLKWPTNPWMGGVQQQWLKVGTQLSRYGTDRGVWASAIGTAFAARSLPYWHQVERPLNAYVVVAPLLVRAGQAAAWFGQKGGGIQYQFGQSIHFLIARGYPERLWQVAAPYPHLPLP